MGLAVPVSELCLSLEVAVRTDSGSSGDVVESPAIFHFLGKLGDARVC